ncbi:MAG: hypothetical protein Q7R33_02670 [Nitrosarchaeum sp.]|nr:hypothetical protein [Nitrosarchaeum sp.]
MNKLLIENIKPNKITGDMNIFPINYDLTFAPDLSKFIFNGTRDSSIFRA